MRDPKRIDTVLEVIKYYWEKHPDLRFGQLILNAVRDPALYYIEDRQFIISMIGAYENYNKSSADREAAKALIKKWTGIDAQFADEAGATDSVGPEGQQEKTC